VQQPVQIPKASRGGGSTACEDNMLKCLLPSPRTLPPPPVYPARTSPPQFMTAVCLFCHAAQQKARPCFARGLLTAARSLLAHYPGLSAVNI